MLEPVLMIGAAEFCMTYASQASRDRTIREGSILKGEAHNVIPDPHGCDAPMPVYSQCATAHDTAASGNRQRSPIALGGDP
jgi:hypothetical protein